MVRITGSRSGLNVRKVREDENKSCQLLELGTSGQVETPPRTVVEMLRFALAKYLDAINLSTRASLKNTVVMTHFRLFEECVWAQVGL